MAANKILEVQSQSLRYIDGIFKGVPMVPGMEAGGSPYSNIAYEVMCLNGLHGTSMAQQAWADRYRVRFSPSGWGEDTN